MYIYEKWNALLKITLALGMHRYAFSPKETGVIGHFFSDKQDHLGKVA